MSNMSEYQQEQEERENLFGADLCKSSKPKENQSVVRLKTNVWCDSKGLHIRKDLQFMKRNSFGYQILEEDSSNIGALEAYQQIINIEECKDGIYEVIMCNKSHDYESGHIDGYDLKLIKFERPL